MRSRTGPSDVQITMKVMDYGMSYLDLSDNPMYEAPWPNDQDFDYLEPDGILSDKLFPAFRDKKALIVPQLQTMNEYIRLHYSDAITDKLCDWIKNGQFCFANELPVEGIPESVTIGEMRFWRENRSSLLADINVSVLVRSEVDSEEVYDEKQWIVQLGFWMEERITYIKRSFCVFATEPDHTLHYPLSEYLIPHLKKNDVEKYTQELLQFHMYEGWKDQHQNNAYELARRLGLTIVHYNLHGYNSTRSILFFRKDTISIDIHEEYGRIVRKETITIPESTIVINDSAVRSSSIVMDIFHECIHWELHYQFYCLQDMYNDDLRQIRKAYRIHFDHSGERDPLSWMEWQARQGSMSLWMPLSFMRSRIHEISQTFQSTNLHTAERLDRIGRSIAREYDIPKYRVRARLINMGYVEAKGALNYLDDHYIKPFCFSRDDNNGNYTFFITFKEFSRLYQEDQNFHKLIDTGNFVYTEGHVCWADPLYITNTSTGPYLTQWANAHVDKCCLRFIEVYEQDTAFAYRFGRLNSDESFNNHFYQYPGCGDITGLTGEQKDQQLRDYIETLPRTFPKLLTRFMVDMKMTEETLILSTGLSERSLTRLRNCSRENYKVDQVVALIAVFQLPPLISSVFLQSAGIDLNGNSQNSKYALVVYSLYQYPLGKIQEMLVNMGFPKLKLSDDNDDRQMVS